LDIDTVLDIIRREGYKKKELYEIYEKQENKQTNKKTRTEIREKLINKFFPMYTDDGIFSQSYHIYWKEKLKKNNNKKYTCNHSISHIRCGKCMKILADATDIYKTLNK
jgi:enolase